MHKDDSPGVLVLTGASGLIGEPLMRAALDQGWRVRVLTRRPAEWSFKHLRLTVFAGDVAQSHDWAALVASAQVVVNAAAEINQAAAMHQVNVVGPLALLKAATEAGVKRWVQLSSVGAYGPVLEGVVTEQWPNRPVGPYETTKTEFDIALKLACEASGMQYTIVRPSNVYGMQMRNQSIHQLVRMVGRGLFVFIGPPGASANYVYVDDVVSATLLCMTHPKAAGQTYIVSTWATMEEMVQAIAEGLGVKCPSKRLDLRLAQWAASVLGHWPRWPLTPSRVQALSSRSHYATTKIETELGWKAQVSVAYGMQQMAKAKAKARA